MLQTCVMVLVSLDFLGPLFAIAYCGDKRASERRSLIANPYIYTLPISKQIIEHLGGRIWVTSEPGRRATFRLPVPTKTSDLVASEGGRGVTMEQIAPQSRHRHDKEPSVGIKR